jgi:hypothetical protein
VTITWLDGVTLTAEWALSAATGTYGAWDSAVWDTSTWGPDVLWTDVSRYLRGPGGAVSISSQRGFSRGLQGWDVGRASVRLGNRDRRFSPSNLSGPYVSAGVTGVRPWRPFRLSATYGGTRYPMYTGYGTDVQETWLPGMADAYVTVPCEDEWARLGAVDGFAQSPVGAGEMSGPRVHRILDAAGYTGMRAIDIGQVTMQATDLSDSIVQALNVTADSEGGAVFIDADGTVIYERQSALVDNMRSNTVQATFGGGSGPELPCWDIAVAYNGDLVRNIASYTRIGGTAQTFADNTSRALYGDRRDSRPDLICETDAQALALAQWRVVQYAQPELRVTQIVVKPRTAPATLFPQVLGRRVRDLIQVVVRPLGGGTIVQNCHIAGIAHAITGDDWVTTFALWSATAYQAVGRWDSATWDSSTFFI